MRFLLTNAMIMLAVLPTLAQPQRKVKEKYDYLLYLPKDYNSTSKDLPLIIYLHGGSLRGSDLNKVKEYGLPQLVERGQDFDFIIASPQCPDGKYWSTDNWFEPLYADLLSKYRVDKKRVYLTGISMGGYGTWQTAVAYPDRLAAIIPLCGGCDDSTRICQIKRIPVWAFHGTADEVIPPGVSEKLVKSLKECNGEVRFTKLDGAGHDIQNVYERREIYDWLSKQRRK